MSFKQFAAASVLALGVIGAAAGTAAADPAAPAGPPAPTAADHVYGPYAGVTVTQYATGMIGVTVPSGILTYQNGTIHEYYPDGTLLL